MFKNIFDLVCLLWSWHWPTVDGEVTAVDVERVDHRFLEYQEIRLAVAYQFNVGDDGPYAGECFWTPAFSPAKKIGMARKRLRIRHKVQVRYRPDDPSVNTLDGGVARLVRKLIR